MTDLDKEGSNSFSDPSENSVHFSQLGSIQEPSLSHLRDQIKKVMIPLLIKAFQYQLDTISIQRSSSKKKGGNQDPSFKEAYEQLKILDQDLKNLQQWCQSCRSQIERALNSPDEELKSFAASSDLEAHPAISKSFADAVSCKNLVDAGSLASNPSFKKWWKALLKKRSG